MSNHEIHKKHEMAKKKNKKQPKEIGLTEFLLYTTPNGNVKVEIFLMNETIWLTQGHMAELFGKAKSTINEHIKNIFSEGELVKHQVMKKFGISEF